MAIVSMRSKKRLLELSLSGLLCVTAFLIQMLFLNYLGVQNKVCNLPLTLVIVFGLVFGSKLPTMTATELRRRSFSEVFARQLASGSHSAFLVGWFFSWLYFSISPVYPVSYPIIGWVAGYFCLRGLGQGNLLVIPMTFILTIFAEAIMGWELFALELVKQFAGTPADILKLLTHSPQFQHLSSFILPEALLNSIIAPFVYFPMRGWYDLVEGQQSSYSLD